MYNHSGDEVINRMNKHFGKATVAAALTLSLAGQTRIDLQTQSKRIDFSAADTTKPIKTGNSLPATCQAGEVFMLLNAPAGANFYACVAADLWARQDAGVPAPTGNNGKILAVNPTGSARWTNLAGDITGLTESVKVTALQNRPIADISPASGQVLLWNAANRQWEPGTPFASSSVRIQSNGTDAGFSTIHNYVAGQGILNALVDTGSAINIQQSVNTAVVQTQSVAQSGTTLLCDSSSGAPPSYRCAMMPTLTSYTSGMVVNWKPGSSASGGSTTLNIDTLGPIPIKLADGTSNPAAGTITAGRLYAIWYDGSVFRLPGAGSSSSGIGLVTTQMLKGDGAGNAAAAVAGTDYLKSAGTGLVADSNGVVTPDPGYVATQASLQRNDQRYCPSTAGSTATAYLCNPAQALPAANLVAGTILDWVPNISGTGGATTLTVNGNSTRLLKQADGVSNPTASDIAAGRRYSLYYDGSVYRLPAAVGGIGVVTAQTLKGDGAGNATAAVAGTDYLKSAGTGLVADSNGVVTPDSSYVATQSSLQRNDQRYCPSAAGSTATAYLCNPVQALSVANLVAGTVVDWVPNLAGTGGATTLNVSSTGAKPVRQADGASNPTSSSIVAGRRYGLYYDGSVYRLPAAGGVGVVTAQILKGDGAGNATAAVAGTDYLKSVGTGLVADSNGVVTPDSSYVATQSSLQRNDQRYCPSAAGSTATAYLCNPAQALPAANLVAGTILDWVPNISGTGGATTLTVSGNSTRLLKQADGVSNPDATDIVAGRRYSLYYDGSAYRLPAAAGGAGAVTVFGRTGPISAQSGDYSASQISNTPGGGITSSTVQAALNELDARQVRYPNQSALTRSRVLMSTGVAGSEQWQQYMNPSSGRTIRYALYNGSGGSGSPVFGSGLWVNMSGDHIDPTATEAAAIRGYTPASSWSSAAASTPSIVFAGGNLYWEAKDGFGTPYGNDFNVFVGLSANGTASQLSNPFSGGQYAGFRYSPQTSNGYDAGDADWKCVSQGPSGGLQVRSSGVPFVNDGRTRFAFALDDTDGTITFWINGTQVCNSASTAGIPSGVALRHIAGISNINNGSVNLRHDWEYVYMESDR